MGARGFTCTICTLPNEVRTQIDNKLRQGIAQKRVAEEYGVSKDAIGRHYRAGHHIITKPKKRTKETLPSLPEDKTPAKYTGPDSVLKSIYKVMNELETMFNNPESDARRLEVAKVIRGFHELSAKIEGLIKEGQVNILVSPGWIALQNDILGALQEYPEARQAVLERLKSHRAQDIEVEYEELT